VWTDTKAGYLDAAISTRSTVTTAEVNTEVDGALNTAIPASNTANSVNDVLLDQLAPRLPGSGTLSTLSVTSILSDSTAFAGADIMVTAEREVLVVDAKDRPGELGRISRKLADAGVNIQLFYISTGMKFVFAVDDPKKAKAAV